MAKLSVIVPSRDERFLTPTLDDIFRQARGEIEVVAVLDSDRWPDNWAEVAARHPNLHTIHNGGSIGMRASINKGVGSAISRGATFIAKFDAHCAFGEGFDEILKAECDDDWVVVPRRLRLEPESWTIADPDKPPYDYHYLSFPDDPNDFGGPGLNGKPWYERQKERAEIPVDDEMSSQGSGWFMHAAYFEHLQLMDEESYGPFWNEAQEWGLKCWLSGGQVKVNKRTYYAHLHKGKKYGRGYRLSEGSLQQGASHTKQWIWNDAWAKQTLPFSWLINHFWPVPTWPDNWEEVLYAERKPRKVGVAGRKRADNRHVLTDPFKAETITLHEGRQGEREEVMRIPVTGPPEATAGSVKADDYAAGGLTIHMAHYGVGGLDDIDVRERLQSLIVNDSLDIVVNNSTLVPGQNPFRGKKKRLNVTYSYNGGDVITATRDEKEWLIIGQAARSDGTRLAGQHFINQAGNPYADTQTVYHVINTSEQSVIGQAQHVGHRQMRVTTDDGVTVEGDLAIEAAVKDDPPVLPIPSHDELAKAFDAATVRHAPPRTPAALNDYLLRKFSISPQRLRAPMPIELRDFHRDDLAVLFAELGFKRGAEIGVAEGNYSEVLLKANPTCELLLVDPWHAYSDNPQNKTKEKHEFAYRETLRKTKGCPGVTIMQDYSMNAVRAIKPEWLDFAYVDANHLFDECVMDIIEWSKRVRSGGIVSGDDYYALDQKRWIGGGVVEAVNAYVNAHRIPVWYVFQGHKSVDFMWVKP